MKKKKSIFIKIILTLFTISIIFNIYLSINYYNLTNAIGVQIGDQSIQNNYYFEGTGKFDGTIKDMDATISQMIVQDLGCTYEITGANSFHYDCNFHPIDIGLSNRAENVLFKFPDGQKAFVTIFPENSRIVLGICRNDYSKCYIFDTYKYSPGNRSCYSTEFSEWSDVNFHLERELC